MPRANRRSHVLYPGLVAALALLAVAWVSFSSRAAANAGAEIAVELAVPAAARVGDPISIEIVAANAHDVAGFQAALSYDDGQLHLTGTESGIGLRAPGRDVVALPPVTRPGAAVLGAVTCPVTSCTARPAPQALRNASGASGRVVLGTVTFYTETAGAYQLALVDIQLVDPQGGVLSSRASGATLNVQP